MRSDHDERQGDSPETPANAKPESKKRDKEKRVGADTLTEDNPFICRGTD